jgi:hypothetical protein
MPFDRELVEAQLALQRIGTTDMPKLAWDALEAGLDGPATRRLAALHFPTFFQVREILPRLLLEWGMAQLSREQGALQLAKRRAREILQGNEDPFKHTYDFFSLWVETDYSRELAEYAELAEEVSIAFDSREPYDQVRDWFLEKLKALASH